MSRILTIVVLLSLLLPSAPTFALLGGLNQTVEIAVKDSVVLVDSSLNPSRETATPAQEKDDDPDKCKPCIRAKIYFALGVIAILVVGIFVI